MTTKRDSPFSSLEALRDKLPAGDKSRPTTTACRELASDTRSLGGTRPSDKPAEPAPAKPKGPARAVVRMERKQRGGKEVTVVEKLELPAKELDRWCRDLKQALGCGGTVEGTSIVLQGDLRQRLPAVLTARGVAKVTVG